jgi:hypothetical protein
LLAKLESSDESQQQQLSIFDSNPCNEDGGTNTENLFNGGFAHNVGSLAARCKDILGKKFDECVTYKLFFDLWGCCTKLQHLAHSMQHY